ncbi:TonB-dependent receptor [Burkholderia multivorans]|uniref:Fe transport n=3 Tax=Burkholderia cepacia complex TaxID=87882 RepID=A0A0H3KQ19_BURM1|nr:MULTISPECIES: TonB-dependent receptor [Burkholderia cepacia complex]AIO71187.1 tonB dependent receptor family protein [Burkholderia multivorans]AOK69478.1 TonB-dependent receptor [Burkholderia multivorans]AYY99577.1 TonB-dependent receptor [Burkholderia multivorans]KVV31585.1 TonB-dependent receptor [Burkholderia multivorans]KVZ83826.1 TonB-dependent receptor [Burkholderia multivorans]
MKETAPSKRRVAACRARIALCCGGAFGGLLIAWPAHAAPDDSRDATTLAPIVVVGTTPLLGLGTPLSRVPSNVQTVRSAEQERQHRSTLTDYLDKNATSVDIAEAQGNPYQPDVNYRGFTASPVVGTPQGLSVFVDGVRINESFGDVVNWDILPPSAIDTLQLIPGSNPTYGLNTLGGALAITTKNGSTSPGGAVEVGAGSWGRKTVQFEQGGRVGDRVDYYLNANVANDNGWADHNASRVRQIFGKLRYTDADTTLSLSAGGADNTLQGTQTIPRSFLDNPRQAYTYPDLNRNRAGYLTLSGDHAFGDRVQLSGNVYYRRYRNTNVSSNVNEDVGRADDDDAADGAQATNDRSTIATERYGASLQLTLLGKPAGFDNQLVLGASADLANARFEQASQPAAFTDSRATIGIGEFQQTTRAKTRNANYGFYFDDTLQLAPQWSLTLAGRYDWARAAIEDVSGLQPLLTARHTFSRFNPAIGVTWNPAPGLTAYATYNEGMRSPTAIELACADPAAPCSLPNDFLADPPLKPVIAKTVEFGARGRVGAATTWSAALYRTTLDDDIQFVSSNGGAGTLGYFQNVGKTRRQGIELAAHTRVGPVGIGVSYSYVDASYRSTWTEHSASNSSADARGNIVVRSGDRIPGIPASTAKLRLDYAATPTWSLGTNLTYRSGVFARGDENNRDAGGKLPGYLLIDVDTTWQATKHLQLFASITNLLDKRYASFGMLGRNFFNGPNHMFDGAAAVDETFVGPGAPRGAWIGMRYAWD